MVGRCRLEEGARVGEKSARVSRDVRPCRREAEHVTPRRAPVSARSRHVCLKRAHLSQGDDAPVSARSRHVSPRRAHLSARRADVSETRGNVSTKGASRSGTAARQLRTRRPISKRAADVFCSSPVTKRSRPDAFRARCPVFGLRAHLSTIDASESETSPYEPSNTGACVRLPVLRVSVKVPVWTEGHSGRQTLLHSAAMAASGVASVRGRLPVLAEYELLEEIGHGGMAPDYPAHDPRLGRDDSAKVIHPQ